MILEIEFNTIPLVSINSKLLLKTPSSNVPKVTDFIVLPEVFLIAPSLIPTTFLLLNVNGTTIESLIP